MIQEVLCLKKKLNLLCIILNLDIQYWNNISELDTCLQYLLLVYDLIFLQVFFSIFIVIVAQPTRFFLETYMSAENKVLLSLPYENKTMLINPNFTISQQKQQLSYISLFQEEELPHWFSI